MTATFGRTCSRGAAIALALALACLSLTSCGSSSSPSSEATAATRSSAKAKTSTSPGPIHVGAGKIHVTPLSECLKKHGVNPPAGGSKGSPAAPPKGVSRSGYEQALRKCGLNFSSRSLHLKALHLNHTAITDQLRKFATCMREHGVDVPEPKTSGAPALDAKGVDTTSKTFHAAESKCISALRGAHHATQTQGATTTG